jgi:pyridoxamine 5'-phosphate oxidase
LRFVFLIRLNSFKFLLMTLAPWRSPLSRALHRNRALPNARYAQLATVRDGRPANRTVVFRGILEPNRLQFITDRRSQKVEQVSAQPWAELCWYFPKTREQFRLLGQLSLVTSESADSDLLQARKKLWHDLSDSARSQFAWPHPGATRSPQASFESPNPDAASPPTTFCLLLLAPTQVDHLELRGNPQNRYCYTQIDQKWTMQEINP